jgi:DNA-binding NtrC family response regulator
LQSKILRVLQDGEFSRVGGNETLKTDVRIVAATNKNLEQEVSKKTFREDLFYRLNVVRVQLPPLRQRTEDIRLLAEYFLQKVSTKKLLPRLQLSEEAVRVLEGYSWPGNVRELENTIQRACVLSASDLLTPKDIPLGNDQPNEIIASGSSRAAAVELTTEAAIEVLLKAAQVDPDVQLLPWLEREFTLYAMKATKGNQVRAAKLLGITRATLRKRIERFGITRELTIS